MRLPVMVIWAASMGCATLGDQERLARELISARPSHVTARAFTTEVHLEQAGLDHMRATLGDELLGLLRLPRGVHSWSVFVFVGQERKVSVAITDMSWGEVQAKWVASLTRREVEALLARVAENFSCSEGPIDRRGFGAVMIRWRQGLQVSCDGGWMSKESAVVGELAQRILDSARLTFEAR